MKAEAHTCSLSKLDAVYRVGFVVVLMFLGYRMVLSCSRSAYLQDYMASSQPSLAVAAPKVRDEANPPTWPLLYPSFANESVVLLQQIRDNATLPCARRRTHTAHLFGLPAPEEAASPVRLRANELHRLTLVAYEENGTRRCAGGDFFETDLSSRAWKSRPPIVDNRDGSYSVDVMVDARFAGSFVFRVVLLFPNFHALDTFNCTAWSRFETVVEVEIDFTVDSSAKGANLAKLELCQEKDFMFNAWSGRWNRRTWNETCEIRDDGRFVCIDDQAECEEAWCDGKVGALDSNGWVYSTHCKFKIFTQDEAWRCLNNRWLFFWGDSNHEDTVRNLLTFVLGFPVHDVNHFRRWHNETLRKDAHLSLTITKIFNGHHEEGGNLLGLASLKSETYRALLASFFDGPDTLVMNSGLHDAHFFKTAEEFASDGVDRAVAFWKERVPARVVYRTTVAGAGFAKDGSHARDGVPNPHKMEIYNRIFVERLRAAVPSVRVVDGFDLTFPFHYDLNCSDGVHYGRAPSKTPWPWHPVHGFGKAVQLGHQYFVDVMLVHILLNAICPPET